MTGARVPGPAVDQAVRGLIPRSLIPVTVLANCLAAALWLRSFPLSAMGIPLLGAAVLSVVLPALLVRVAGGRLWPAALLDLLAFVVFALVVVLHDPTGVAALAHGLYRGPSEVLTFAVPLISPRSLMVAPVALVWLTGAIAGEYTARQWVSPIPYAALLTSFGLAYAGTARAVQESGTRSFATRETLLAAGLLVTLLVMRATQSWVRQDQDAETTQPDGVLPLRSLAAGALTALLVAAVVGALVQADAFGTKPAAPQRVPSVDSSDPVNPVSFVAGLRPSDPRAAGDPAFTVTTSADVPGYFTLANVDHYDGSGWTFSRTFRPSGGILPDDVDLSLTQHNVGLSQQYRIDPGPLDHQPWMPYVSRPQRINDIAIDADASSGMIIPTSPIRSGDEYTIRSTVPLATFADLDPTAAPDSLTSTENTQLPPELAGANLGSVINALAAETGASPDDPMGFLHAVQEDFRTHYFLRGGTPASATSSSPSGSPSPAPSATASGSTGDADTAGSTSFIEVAASILGDSRTGTPEQYATLTALIARQLNIPARLATGFRVHPEAGRLRAGTYHVTTADAWTWVAVPVTGAGWVVLDPAPSRFGNNKPTSSQSRPAPTSALPTATPSGAQIGKNAGQHPVAPPSDLPEKPMVDRSTILWAVLGTVAAIVVALLGLLLLRKPVRAWHRRRRPSPRDSLLGAWHESIDVLAESGLPPLDSLTSAEIAALAADRFGSEPGARVGDLGAMANAVVFSARTDVRPEHATAAWQTHRALRRSVRRSLGRRDRLAAALRYHRTRRHKPPAAPGSWADTAAAPAARVPDGYVGRRRKH